MESGPKCFRPSCDGYGKYISLNKSDYPTQMILTTISNVGQPGQCGFGNKSCHV